MKWKKVLPCISFMLVFLSSHAQETSIDEKKYILVGGIEQWITIKGDDRSNPVILLLHGGPGSPISPYSEGIFGDWEINFTLVNWDQRGAGKTFGRNAPAVVDEDYFQANPLSLEQMTADGIEVSEYVRKYLGRDKIILFGTSWGSALGASMAIKRPDIYYAYVGHSQLVTPSEDIIQVFHATSQLAYQQNDSTAVELLKSIGTPPYHSAKHMGQLLRIVKKYEYQNATPAPDSWWAIASEYDNKAAEMDRYNGDDYSFVYYTGHQQLGINGMINTINFLEDGIKFDIPVVLIQGEEDILTPLSITSKYFDKIESPEKALVVVPGAAHGLNPSVVDAAYNLILEKILPTVNNGTDTRK